MPGPELRKPVDIGNGLAAASFDGQGRLLSLTTADPRCGIVELTAGPRFDESWRGQPSAVRGYRAQLAQPATAVLTVELCGAPPPASPRLSLDDHGRPTWRATGPGWRCDTVAWVPAGVRETALRIRLASRGAGTAVVTFGGRLTRPSLAEITEISPLPPDSYQTGLLVTGPRAELAAPGLPLTAAAAVWVSGAGAAPWQVADSRARLTVTWPDKAARVEIVVRVRLLAAGEVWTASPPDADHRDQVAPGISGAPQPAAPGRGPQAHRHLRRGDDPSERIIGGAVRYSRDCAALSVGPDQCCLITDHRLLPLSWTRDAYYQALLLIVAGGQAGHDVVARHLRWLWGPAFRQDGWQRSHLVTGEVKDHAFQPDQQLYPILEVLDYRRATGAWPPCPAGHSWPELIRRAWSRLVEQRPGLVAAEENPADDPAALPFGLSTQILRWYTAQRLAAAASELNLQRADLADIASRIRRAVRDRFTCAGPQGQQWSYETDGDQTRRLYQDANDLPTALAPAFGFCPADDPAWQATMRFAFSPDNPGFVAGPLAGLGSLHSPGVWPLGDVQEWTWARLTGDLARCARVLRRLGHVAGLDGMLPESYHQVSGQWLGRHWFAWPGAAFGASYLLWSCPSHPWRP